MILIALAGVGAGAINAIVGSGTLITFPTLVTTRLSAGDGDDVQRDRSGRRRSVGDLGLPPRTPRASGTGCGGRSPVR